MKYIHIPTGVRVESDAPLPEAIYRPAGDPEPNTPKAEPRKAPAKAGRAAKKGA